MKSILLFPKKSFPLTEVNQENWMKITNFSSFEHKQWKYFDSFRNCIGLTTAKNQLAMLRECMLWRYFVVMMRLDNTYDLAYGWYTDVWKMFVFMWGVPQRAARVLFTVKFKGDTFRKLNVRRRLMRAFSIHLIMLRAYVRFVSPNASRSRWSMRMIFGAFNAHLNY